MKKISIRGARTHNLKNIDLDLPRDKLIVMTGLSGSGKSSLAFDTIYAEGQRRYVESLSAYARQFLSMMEKPDVDHIEGLSPAIAIEQKSTSHNPRSTVGTVTEINDYLRLLYARTGKPRCPDHGNDLEAQTISQMVDQVLNLPNDTRLMLLAPVVQERKGEHIQLMTGLQAQGFVRARINGEIFELDDPPKLDLRRKHTIDVVIDRFKVKKDLQLRLSESFETALKINQGVASVAWIDDPSKKELIFSNKFACPECGYSLAELEPRLFSFNNPIGACAECDGLGVKQFFDPERVIHNGSISLAGGAIRGWNRRNSFYSQMLLSLADHFRFDIETPYKDLDRNIKKILLYGCDEDIQFIYRTNSGKKYLRTHPFEGVIPNLNRRYKETESGRVREELSKYLSIRECPECNGSRLNISARNVFINNLGIANISEKSVANALSFFDGLDLSGSRGKIASKIVKEIANRLRFLSDVGLEYLSLDRSAETLSGGEAQRIRLASQIGSGLVGVMYILDEPSIGLHQRDNARLLSTLNRLRDLGNTVVVVEHDQEAIEAADYIVDLGPGAGVHGGHIVAIGNNVDIMNTKDSLTGQYLAGNLRIKIPLSRLPNNNKKKQIKIFGASGNNLKKINVNIPIGLMSCITGVSGSGKSTLINDTLYMTAAEKINKANKKAAPCKSIEGLEHLDRIIDISQSPIGRTPRSNPATYTGIFTHIRELFSGTQEARSRGYKTGRFSFNVKGGRCEACEGDGVIRVEMHFLPDVYVTCDVCKGKRYNRETQEIKYKGYSISEVLDMTVDDAFQVFQNISSVSRKLETLQDVGLSYIRLGQSATTLSGGEAQRIKLAKELSKRSTGSTLYILDEPTTGLHFHDIAQLLNVLKRLRDQGNTVIIIEHNLDVIKTADWVIDLGPEGGDGGGEILACGTPEEIAEKYNSYTGKYLKPLLQTIS
ncbi:MAG: excinuclease ABC subunit UvrA [Pseudomonadota bacterium]|nr:excinuclease ABC subunit UvrA [Pseudomonadota bacterium]